MPISVICPSCGTKLNAPDQHAGKRGKCPKCQATVELALQHEDVGASFREYLQGLSI